MEQEDDLGRKAFKVDQASALGSLRVTALKPQRTPEKKTFQKEKKKVKGRKKRSFGKAAITNMYTHGGFMSMYGKTNTIW